MSWLKPILRSRLLGLLGQGAPSRRLSRDDCIDDIREAMLELLGDDAARRFPQVTRRVRYAADVEVLWYLRGDLMAVLATLHGEAKARAQMADITDRFRGLLPGGMSSRPSPLQ